MNGGRLATHWFQILQQNGDTSNFTSTFHEDLGYLVGTAFQLGLSFALILCARQFTEWWWKRQKL